MKMARKITISDFRSTILIILTFIPGLVLRFIKKDIWIISERKDEARDNGYWLFRYIRESTDKKNVYYAIGKNAVDRSKLENFGNIITFGSIKHFIYTWAAELYISTQYSNGMPGRICYYGWLYGLYNFKYVFLQHGVTKDKSLYLIRPADKVSLICCVNGKEADFIKSLGYHADAVKICGFSRFDNLCNQITEHHILVMPTWRNYLSELSLEDFKISEYYLQYQRLLENTCLNKVLEEKRATLNFLVHPGMKKFNNVFRSTSKYINVCNNVDIQNLINSSIFLITDYSSIAFDFAYLCKPVCYFQFDLEEFRAKHLQEGYFVAERDGFGPVYTNVKEVISFIETKLDNSNPDAEYLIRMNDFFRYKDNKNCQRIFETINRLGGGE